MRLSVRLIGAALAVVTMSASPMAHAAASPGAGNLSLGRQLIEAAGGEEEMRALLKSFFGQMSARLKATIPEEQARQREAIQQKLLERLLAETPELVDRAGQIYAENLTDQEMRDWIAWLRSDSGKAMTRALAVGAPPTEMQRRDELAWEQSESGQSIGRKLPAIKSDTIQTLAPMLARVTEGLRVRDVDDVCRQLGCTARDREVLAAALEKVLPKQPN